MQSPKSKRASEPGMASKDDGMTETTKGGQVSQQGPSGSGAPSVPKGLDRSPGKHQGNVEAESAVPTHSPAPHQGGGPKMDTSKGQGTKTGGSEHLT